MTSATDVDKAPRRRFEHYRAVFKDGYVDTGGMIAMRDPAGQPSFERFGELGWRVAAMAFQFGGALVVIFERELD